ncbi:MAG TPA: FtsX-like permease family protein [Vicinamibacterales bacterium]|nr:FtsX-like permease family protein [Vicinamibacterales bacterium]
MKFVLAMAARETRASWRRLLFFFVCIAIGVAAIVALRSVIQSVRAVFGSEARSLVAADVLISTNRDWAPETRHTIDNRLSTYGATERTETAETITMVRPGDGRPVTRLVELRAVEPAFPLYGELTLDGGTAYSHALLENHGALVRPELLTALHVAVGDRIMIGSAPFTIRGVIANEPGRRVGGFSVGPRVLVDFGDLPSTGLVTLGSRIRRVLLVRLPEDRIEPLVQALHDDFKEEFVTARSYRGTDDEVGRDFDRAENYLSLVGLIIVILGGIAVSSVTRVFVLQKMRSIAVLKCIGARSSQIIAIYVLQVLALGLAGSLLGVAIARGAIALIPYAIGPSTALLSEVHYGVTFSAAAQGVSVGVLVALLFSIVPLLHVRLVKPSMLLRDEVATRGIDWTRVVVVVLVAAALVAITAWQAASIRAALVVCAGFVALAAVLVVTGQALVRAVRPLSRTRVFPLRHAVLHISRPGNQTRVILLAVGLGAFFIVGVRSLQASLLDEFSIESSADAPDMFLVDIQPGQIDGMRAFLADPSHGAGRFQLIPVLRARITAVNGTDASLGSYEDVRARGSLAREFEVTYRDRLEPNEKIVAGTFERTPSSDAEVSIEQDFHDRNRIGLGDSVRFDILGRVLTARVTSIREVDWKDSRSGGFIFVFRPGVLEKAPQTFISPLRGPVSVEARAKFQHDLVDSFPNVSVIDFHEILASIEDVMSKVTLAITVVGGLVLGSGILILIGAVAMTKFQRVYEAAVFKTLGATTRTIAAMLLLEYGVLGLLAGTVGSIGAVGLTWGVSRYALDIKWRLFPGEHLGAIVATAVLVAGIGVISSLDVLREKPLLTLRTE